MEPTEINRQKVATRHKAGEIRDRLKRVFLAVWVAKKALSEAVFCARKQKIFIRGS